ncbi:hypothetical protein BDZ97DRAFT_1657744 [Flammula alnicola]|nr:hypothetical protein BDZ97DRAFT_1657744 [Flammula alnicola]
MPLSVHTARLARLFTSEYARRINAQIVHPAESVVVKPNELASSLVRPLHVSVYEPDRPVSYLAATLAYGIIKGHPFKDGNKRTGFFLANEYTRMMGVTSGLTDTGKVGEAHESVANIATRYMDVAAGKLDVAGLANATPHHDDPTSQGRFT